MTFLGSLLFNAYFFGWTALASLLGLPLLLAGWRTMNGYGRWWAGTILAGLRLFCRLDGRVSGLQHLPAGPFIVAMKHQSAWDTLMAPQVLAAPAFVLKRELIRIPLFGWYLRHCRMLPVDRSAGAAALKQLLRDAQARKAEGRPIVIYPEGTRRAPGAPPAYQPGVAALYLALALPVVPVALNSGLYWGRQRFAKRPGTIAMEVLEPIPPGLSRHDFMARLEASIEGATARLIAADEPPR